MKLQSISQSALGIVFSITHPRIGGTIVRISLICTDLGVPKTSIELIKQVADTSVEMHRSLG